jgi:general stress protein YciG
MVVNKRRGTSNRGFASMDANKQREIARKGGQSVPAENRTFSRNHELASQAGRKGGEHSHGSTRRNQSGDATRPASEGLRSDQKEVSEEERLDRRGGHLKANDTV